MLGLREKTLIAYKLIARDEALRKANSKIANLEMKLRYAVKCQITTKTDQQKIVEKWRELDLMEAFEFVASPPGYSTERMFCVASNGDFVDKGPAFYWRAQKESLV